MHATYGGCAGGRGPQAGRAGGSSFLRPSILRCAGAFVYGDGEPGLAKLMTLAASLGRRPARAGRFRGPRWAAGQDCCVIGPWP